MSAVGFDIGNENCIVAVVQHREVNIALNEESKRETPTVVCFGDKQRLIGTAAAAASSNNSVSQIKRLIGRRFSDADLQRDLRSLPFAVTEGPDGFPLIHVRYRSEQRSFTPTQLLGMILSKLKGIAEANLGGAVVADCCIGVPVYFTDLQRRTVLDAARITGLRPLRLLHETTAIALAYGNYKTDLPENDQLNVAFIDIGHTSMQVCIAGFKKGQMKILAQSYDRSLGGRDFDEVLVKHFAAEFKEKHKIDVYSNATACRRLRTACEKLKKELSGNSKAQLIIVWSVAENDVRGFITREEFEQISVSILERVKGPLEKALADAQMTVENIHSVEVVGSGSRVPAIIRIVTEFFSKEPRRTMDASECVARGIALQCAMLIPTFKVLEFQVHEGFPSSIALAWKSPESQYAESNSQQSVIVFPKGNPIPSIKALTFYRSSTFSVDILYANASDLQIPPKISTYTIGPFKSTRGDRAKLKLKVRLNLHGIVSIEAATMMEEVGLPVSAMQMDTSGKTKLKKTNLPVVELVYGAMVPVELQNAVEEEFQMALQDRVIEESKGKKDAMEAHVHDMRNKKEELSVKLQEVLTAERSSTFEHLPLQEKEKGVGSLEKVKDSVTFEENMEGFDVKQSPPMADVSVPVSSPLSKKVKISNIPAPSSQVRSCCPGSSASRASRITAPSQSSGPIRQIRNREGISKLAFEGLLRGLIMGNALPTLSEFSEMMNSSKYILEQLGSGDLFGKWHPNMLSVEALLSKMEDIEAEGDLTEAEASLKQRLSKVVECREAYNTQLSEVEDSEARTFSMIANHKEELAATESQLEALRMEIKQLEGKRDELKKNILVDGVAVGSFRRQKELIAEDLHKLAEDEATVQRDIEGLHFRAHCRQEQLQELRSNILDRLSSVDKFLSDSS